MHIQYYALLVEHPCSKIYLLHILLFITANIVRLESRKIIFLFCDLQKMMKRKCSEVS